LLALGFELRTSYLLTGALTAWGTLTVLFCDGFFLSWGLVNCLLGGLYCDPPDLCLLSSWDYRCEPSVPSSLLYSDININITDIQAGDIAQCYSTYLVCMTVVLKKVLRISYLSTILLVSHKTNFWRAVLGLNSEPFACLTALCHLTLPPALFTFFRLFFFRQSLEFLPRKDHDPLIFGLLCSCNRHIPPCPADWLGWGSY
jgi:hypothetical protein